MGSRNPPSKAQALRNKYEFRWEVLDVIIGGKSSIDSPGGFRVATLDDADRFIESYGFRISDPIENAELLGNYREALNFIRKHFLQPENPQGLKIEIPRKILELADVRELFLMSDFQYPGQTEDTQGQLLRNWACSLLKVMHTIAHIDKDPRASYYSDVQQQIFDRFYKFVHRDAEQRLYLGEREEDPQRIDLVAFESKPKKARDSIILKLLHKPENVAEELFDRVGIRFVTQTKLDALRVVKYLKDKRIIMPPNIKPSRSRNTLVEIEPFRARMAELLKGVDTGEVDEARLVSELELAADGRAGGVESNPHSSEFYRAIQFTCRQLIKLRHPLFEDLRDLKSRISRAGRARAQAAEGTADETLDEIIRIADRIDLKHLQREVRFFFPFEVQIVDEKSFEENERGRSAHSEYKRNQIQTAMKRVMGALAHGGR